MGGFMKSKEKAYVVLMFRKFSWLDGWSDNIGL